MGDEAVARSTRQDRSRDPLYNQLKMYAELFRALGWLHPTEDSSLSYTFTLLGHQVIAAERNYLPIFGESVLGISYPSHVLKVKGDFDLRPFAFILRTMLAAGGYLSTGRNIVGPLSANSDRNSDSATLLGIQDCRACAITCEANQRQSWTSSRRNEKHRLIHFVITLGGRLQFSATAVGCKSRPHHTAMAPTLRYSD